MIIRMLMISYHIILCAIRMCTVRFLTSTQTWTRIVFPIYVYSLIWALLPLFGWGGYEVEPYGLSCTLAWGHPDLGNGITYYHTSFIIANGDLLIMQHDSRRETVYYYCKRMLRLRTDSTHHRKSRRDLNTYSANWSDTGGEWIK